MMIDVFTHNYNVLEVAENVTLVMTRNLDHYSEDDYSIKTKV